MIDWLYQNALKPLLFKMEPDTAHDLFVQIGILCGKNPILKRGMGSVFGSPSINTPIKVDGITYHGPVLLSAGFDYNGHLSPILFSLGFSGEEVGSVTARPCPGNAPPRLRRLIKSKSIQVYKGLKNEGVDKIISRIKSHHIPANFVLGISIAKTNDELSASESEGIKDYCYSFKRLNEENVGSFYTINISCPNAFGGEDFAKPQPLERLLAELRKIDCKRPVYIKMPINLDWNEFCKLLEVIDRHQINGVVIGNLNKRYEDAEFQDETTEKYRGGLSGKPCQKLSTELIKKTRQLYPEMTIMGCGGIMTPEDALEKLEAGANLVQLITGMIFYGPGLIKKINLRYKKRFSC